uniref:Poly-gamma-glutamate system protein n=1 Tax=candidate division WOR-3 bacterium TaxID=2052148 RepID=A0A7C6EJM3_UNCW3
MRSGRLPNYILVFVALISLLFIFFALQYKTKIYARFYQEKIESARRTKVFFEKIKEERLKRGLTIDPINDPNQTGLIGLEHSPITSEPGDLKAKLTTTNPNISAIIIELFKRCHLNAGDVVAISFSGSFPALNLAVLSAIQTLNLKPIIITSVSSSMWGANIPEFTYLDMESILYQNGLLKFRSVAASLGGIDDIGRGLSPEGRNMIETAIKRNGVQELKSKDLEEAIEKRLKSYYTMAGEEKIACFINIGGGATALAGYELPTGILDPLKYSFHQGLAGRFLNNGVRVININNINHLTRRYELPIAPIPIPEIGEGKLYYENRYSVTLSTIFLVILSVIIFVVLRVDLDYYIRRHKND